MFRTNKKRTLERQVPFTEKYAVELKALERLIDVLSISFVCFALGFILGGAV